MQGEPVQDRRDGQEEADGVDLTQAMGLALGASKGMMQCQIPEEYQVGVVHPIRALCANKRMAFITLRPW